jgi:hypothetical protein
MTQSARAAEVPTRTRASAFYDPLWDAAEALFPAAAFMIPSATWGFGLSGRTAPKRLARLTATRRAKRLEALLDGTTTAALQRLLTRSQVNLEQARAAQRINLIMNISVPTGAFVFLTQAAPDALRRMIDMSDWGAIILGLGFALSILLGLLWFTQASVTAARDLHHLLVLLAADRGVYDGGRTSEDDSEYPGAA